MNFFEYLIWRLRNIIPPTWPEDKDERRRIKACILGGGAGVRPVQGETMLKFETEDGTKLEKEKPACEDEGLRDGQKPGTSGPITR